MKAIFLDRDGVVNKYPGDKKYVVSLRGFKFLPGARKAAAILHKKGYKLFVVSNQACVGKGIITHTTLDKITDRMLKGIRKYGGDIERVYYCTHKPEDDCRCRKPKAGNIFSILKEYPVDLKQSYFIGDTIRDVHTAKAAGCASILVLSGKEKLSNRKEWEEKPDFILKDFLTAAKFISKKR